MSALHLSRRSLLQAVLGVLAEGTAARAIAGTDSAIPSAVLIGPEKLLAAQLRFGQRLVFWLAGNQHAIQNIVVSPASLAGVLALLDLGATDQMRSALHKACGFRPARQKLATADFEGIRAAISSTARKSLEGGPLTTANMIIFDPSTRPFQLALLGLAAAGADVSLEALDKPEVISRINEWVKDKTKGLIPEILDETSDDLGLVAVNALHFKDRWKIPFNPADTAKEPFHSKNGKVIDVLMMHLPEGTYSFRQDDRFVGVELAYAADDYKVVLVTTKSRIARAADFADAWDWLNGSQFSQKRGELALPKFSLSESTELLKPLDAMGLAAARSKSDALGGFSSRPQVISRVIQKTLLRLDEEGTEGAAATAAATVRALSAQQEYVKVIVDKPFVFALRDQRTGLILLTGYVSRPSGGQPRQ